MDAVLNWAFNTPRGCYVLGSVMLAFTMMLYLLSHRRLKRREDWLVVATCLPIMNFLFVAYIALEMVTVITGNPIVIGRRRR